jgi:hypothetical protein
MVSTAVSDFRLGIRWKFVWKKWCSRTESNRDLPFGKHKLIIATLPTTFGWISILADVSLYFLGRPF